MILGAAAKDALISSQIPIVRLRVKAGIAHARSKGRPKTAALKDEQIKNLHEKGYNKSRIARELGISRTSVRRVLRLKAMEEN